MNTKVQTFKTNCGLEISLLQEWEKLNDFLREQLNNEMSTNNELIDMPNESQKGTLDSEMPKLRNNCRDQTEKPEADDEYAVSPNSLLHSPDLFDSFSQQNIELDFKHSAQHAFNNEAALEVALTEVVKKSSVRVNNFKILC